MTAPPLLYPAWLEVAVRVDVSVSHFKSVPAPPPDPDVTLIPCSLGVASVPASAVPTTLSVSS